MAISFLLIGIIVTLFIHHINRWLNRASLFIFKVAPWLNFTDKNEDELIDEWAKSGFNIFMIWFLRIMGFMLVGFSAYIIYILIFRT